MIIDRYLIREIAKPLVIFCSALVIMFGSYTAGIYLGKVADGLLPAGVVMPLVLLKAAIALEVLLPIALHLSVVVALGRLYSDSEMMALSACGVSSVRVLRVVLWVSLLVASVVACLSLYVRPWANETRYWIENKAAVEFDFNSLEAGRFYEGPSGNRVIFAERVDSKSHRMQGVFIQRQSGDTLRVISAQEAYYLENEPNGGGELVCLNTHVYEVPRDGNPVLEVQTQELILHLEEPELPSLGYKRKAASTLQLANSSSSMDIAELQWRLSTPLSTLLLGLLGFPLSRAEARQGRYAKLSAAVLIYAVYYNLNLVAKTWVEQGVVAPVPGLWWVHALLAALLAGLILQPALVFRWRARLTE